MAISQAYINDWFTYHDATSEQIKSFHEINVVAKIFAETINKHCPNGADKNHAIRVVRDARMWANAAVVCGQAPALLRPTIAELESILAEKDDTPITINTDGSITVDS